MGLDMYLYQNIFIGAEYEYRKVTGTIDIQADGKKIDIDLSKLSYVCERIAYWRKANAVHRWFVENLADGVDDCKPINVSSGDLIKLRDLCSSILAEQEGEQRNRKAMELLPPQEGFFFGSTEIDQGYYEDLQYTVKALSGIVPFEADEYIYEASW